MTVAAARSLRTDPAFVRLAATVPLRAEPGAVARVLTAGVSGWEERSGPAGARRYAADLRLRIGPDGSGLTTFRKAAYVDLGEVRPAPDGFIVELGWCAATAAPLFPVFSGQLRIGPDRMNLTGLYAPPGGAIGRVADRALLHVAATGTARWLLEELNRAAASAES